MCCPGAKPACIYSWPFLRRRILGLGAVEKYPFLLGKYLHAKPDIPIGLCEALNLLKGRIFDLCWGTVDAWTRSSTEDTVLGVELTETVSWRTLNTFQSAGPTFCKIHMLATEQRYYHFTLSFFTMKADRICCVCLSSWVRNLSSLKQLSSQAFLQLSHSTSIILKPPEKPPETSCCCITGNM